MADTTIFERHKQLARASLRELLVFNEALEREIGVLTRQDNQGEAIDRELLEKMTIAKEKFEQAMQGFLTLDNERQRHVLIIFADAVQDLMKYIHKRRDH